MLNRIWRELKYNRQRKIIIFLMIISLISFIYYTLSVKSYSWYVSNKKINGDTGHPCVTPVEEMDELKKLTRDMHRVLGELKLTHVLIYGSLWGAIRFNNPVPWDNDVDLLLLDSEVNNIDFETLKHTFKENGMDITYRVWLGTYRVTRGNFARADLMVFRNTYLGNYMCRTGLEPWVLFVNHFRYHTFPASLLKKPLATTTFAGVNISVPNDGIEIQKHFYPNDWWKVVKPKGC